MKISKKEIENQREHIANELEQVQDELDNLNLEYSKDFSPYHELLISMKEDIIDKLWDKYYELDEVETL